MFPEEVSVLGFKMLCDPVDQNIYPKLRDRGVWEKTTTEKLDEIFTGGVFVDCGAHWGYYSLLASSRAEHVYSFEANPETFRYLALNVLINHLQDKITAYPLALWNAPARMQTIKTKSNTGGTGVSLADEGVEAVTLDSVLERADFLKVDCEGSDHFVLEGAKELIAKCHPKILVEHPEDLGRASRALFRGTRLQADLADAQRWRRAADLVRVNLEVISH